MTSSIIRELLKLTEKPDVISFAGGLPAPEVFPAPKSGPPARRCCASKERQRFSMPHGRLPALRELLARHMASYGIKVKPANVLITSGSQQGLDLVGRLFVNPGDRILTESPTYLGALQAWSAYQADYLTVPVDDDGLDVDQLERQLRGGPKFLYILPNFQNPRCHAQPRAAAPADRAGEPLRHADRRDDPYGRLRFEGEHLPSLVEVDAELHGSQEDSEFTGDVLYSRPSARRWAPGLRIAGSSLPSP